MSEINLDGHKVGDKVRILRNIYGEPEFTDLDIYEISHVSKLWVGLIDNLGGKSSYESAGWCFLNSELEKV